MKLLHPSRPISPHRMHESVRSLCARAIWSRFASTRAELVGSPSLSRPNLFSGD
jgi:hypothetical protein